MKQNYYLVVSLAFCNLLASNAGICAEKGHQPADTEPSSASGTRPLTDEDRRMLQHMNAAIIQSQLMSAGGASSINNNNYSDSSSAQAASLEAAAKMQGEAPTAGAHTVVSGLHKMLKARNAQGTQKPTTEHLKPSLAH